MIELGYAVMVKGTDSVVGICPVPLDFANKTKERYDVASRAAGSDKEYDIHPVYVGAALSPSVLPPIVSAGGKSG
jgi:hypothetical protein